MIITSTHDTQNTNDNYKISQYYDDTHDATYEYKWMILMMIIIFQQMHIYIFIYIYIYSN